MTELPILSHREEIVKAFSGNQVVIVVGETGSGKTTQIAQFLHGAGFTRNGMIGVTEPRQIAAISVAEFVADEMGSPVGGLVGYTVRNNCRMGPETRIRFMTDGILLREFQGRNDPDLKKYSVIVIDEAHERSVNIDFALGLLKRLLARRSDLKVVVMSATINAEKFSAYFGGAPIVEVSGRQFDVDERYLLEETPFSPEKVAETVVMIHEGEDDGDILVFLPGKEEIMRVAGILEECKDNTMVVLPLFAELDPAAQKEIFRDYPRKRKVILATNIAETSITVPGIVYVVDSGLVKQKNFHPETGIQSLDTVEHSQAGCDQRKGRAGRTRSGVCFRLYTEENFLGRLKYTVPEIRRVTLASVVLSMEDIGIEDVDGFDFIDPPPRATFHEAYETLIALGAIAPGKEGITALGRQMAALPLEPHISRMLIEAVKHGCVSEIATVAAFLSVKSVFFWPKERSEQCAARAVQSRFRNWRSDALASLAVWREFVGSGFSRDWCRKNYLNERNLFEVRKIRDQLMRILEDEGFEISSSEDEDAVVKCVCAGLIHKLLESSICGYRGALKNLGDEIRLHGGALVFRAHPQWVVAKEVVGQVDDLHISRGITARFCTAVEPKWLPEFLPNLFFYRQAKISSFNETTGTAWATRELVFRDPLSMSKADRVISRIESELDIAGARKLQKTAVQEAINQGWIKLKFAYSDGGMCAVSDGWSYQLSSDYTVYPMTGEAFYCQVTSFDGRRQASPRFKVFDLGGDDGLSLELESSRENPVVSVKEALANLRIGGESVAVTVKEDRSTKRVNPSKVVMNRGVPMKKGRPTLHSW